MEEFDKTDSYSTEMHSDEIDFIFDKEHGDIDEIVWKNSDLVLEFKTLFRLLRKKFSSKIREKLQKNFTNIIYLTLDCPTFTPNSTRDDNPLEFVTAIKNQYPDNDIRLLIPIINVDEYFRTSKKLVLEVDNKIKVLEKTNIKFEFYLQNKKQEATVYKFPKDISNIDVYGIYSPSFSRVKNISGLSRLQYLSPFIKSARIAIKKFVKEDFVPDIVHCENIPFFLGGEFDNKFPYQIKVLQTIKDFTQIDVVKMEAFWAIINIADKRAMKKLCNDSLIKKYVASLFNLHNTKRFYQMKECLNFIYKNYYKFRKFIDKGDDIDENIIFNRLNARTLQLFPQIAYEEELYFHPMISTLKRANYWITASKSYYKEVIENPLLSGKMYRYIERSKERSTYFSYGLDLNKFPLENTRQIYQCFNIDNFRELRVKNKQLLLKEFSVDRIKTNFVDPTLFKGKDVKIVGNLDSFYDAPILFANPTTEIFAQGIDILFNTLLKLFELHKNIQIIICIKDGLKINFIKTWIDFLSQNKYLNGRWVFIDGEISLPKFLSASDMILLPRRANMTSVEHFLAMHYGCVPIVSRNGILNDTVSDIFDDINLGCGFKTKKSLLSEEDSNELFLVPVIKALNLYQNNPSSWNLLVKNCMNKSSGWEFSILEKYNKIYKDLI